MHHGLNPNYVSVILYTLVLYILLHYIVRTLTIKAIYSTTYYKTRSKMSYLQTVFWSEAVIGEGKDLLMQQKNKSISNFKSNKLSYVLSNTVSVQSF